MHGFCAEEKDFSQNQRSSADVQAAAKNPAGPREVTLPIQDLRPSKAHLSPLTWDEELRPRGIKEFK
jgi:hypothetical protein